MASSLPLSTTTTKLSNAPPHNKPSLLKPSQLSLHRSRSKFVVSCKATENDETQDPNAPNAQNAKNLSTMLARRNMLLGLGGLYGVASTAIGGSIPASLAEPLAPDVSQCFLTNTGDNGAPGSTGKECCLNLQGLEIPDFKFENYRTVMKTRPAAHKVDAAYIKDFEDAIAMMRALPDNDPRSLNMQALIHCAYCDGVYRHQGHPTVQYEVHESSLFYPFHRWYLYFFERIAGELIGKPDFALPFWAWDTREGMKVPQLYKDENSPLYDPTRAQARMNRVVDLNFIGNIGSDITDEELMEDNLNIMFKEMVDVKRELFMGFKYEAGGESSPGSGTIEEGAHTMVHVWTGGNIGLFSTSGKDPLFYGHHGNVDRMWHIWETKLRSERSKRSVRNFDEDYMNSSFIFFDEKGQPVRVYVKDAFDMRKLGYSYEDLPLEWLPEEEDDGGNNPGPNPGRGGGRGGRGGGGGRGGRGGGGGRGGRGGAGGRGGRGGGGRGGRGGGGGRGGRGGPGGRGGGGGRGGPRTGQTGSTISANTFMMPSAVAFPTKLDSVLRTTVTRPRKSRSEEEKEVEEEVIIVGVELSATNDEFIRFDVYINDEYDHDPKERTMVTEDYAGNYATLPMAHNNNGHVHKTTLRLGLNRVLQDIGAEDDDTLQVTLVPRAGLDAIVITSIKIGYVSD